MRTWLRSLVLWAVLFSISTSFLVFIVTNLPHDEQTGSITKILPTNLQNLQTFSDTLSEYTERHRKSVLLVFSCTYIYKQAFSIPGSVLLNLIAGVLFDLWLAFPLCCLLSSIGASGAYWQSYFLGKELIEHWMPKKLAKLQTKLRTQQMGLLSYLIFIRLFPFTPNWFINMASPIIGVPFIPFAISVFFGLMPYNFVTTQAGDIIHELNSTKDIFNATTIGKLLLCSLVFLSIPLAKRFILPRLVKEDKIEKSC